MSVAEPAPSTATVRGPLSPGEEAVAASPPAPEAAVGSVVGRVLDPEGRPVAGASPGWTQRRNTGHTVTDAEGGFVLADVPLGALTVGAFPPRGRDDLAFGSTRVRVPWPGAEVRVDLTLGRTAPLEVRLLWPPGARSLVGSEPFDLPRIEARPRAGARAVHGRVGSSGPLVLRVPPGPCDVVLWDELGGWFAQAEVVVEAFGAALTLTPRAAAALAGRVVGAGGRPVRAEVLVRGVRPTIEFTAPFFGSGTLDSLSEVEDALRATSRAGFVRAAVTDAAGRFELGPLPPGEFQAVALPLDLEHAAATQPLTLDEGGSAEVTLVVGPAPPVVLACDRVLRWARVSVSGPPGVGWTVQGDHVLWVTGLAGGDPAFVVVQGRAGDVGWGAAVAVRGGQPAAALPAPPCAAIRVEAFDGAGRRLGAGVRVELLPQLPGGVAGWTAQGSVGDPADGDPLVGARAPAAPGAPGIVLETEASGWTPAVSLPTGRWTVHAAGAAPQDVELGAGDHRDVSVVLP